MESEFLHDNENFEQFLKDSTQDFKMYPSRKVWYSLYNNLHPGSKWPSLAVCLILVSTILIIDISNNNKISKINQPFSITASTSEDGKYLSDIGTSGTRFITNGPVELEMNVESLLPFSMPTASSTNRIAAVSIPKIKAPTVHSITKNKSRTEHQISKALQDATVDYPNAVSANAQPVQGNLVTNIPVVLEEAKSVSVNSMDDALNLSIHSVSQSIVPTGQSVSEPGINTNISVNQKKEKVEMPSQANTMSNDLSKKQIALQEQLWQQSWIDDYAFYNKPKISKWKKRANMQFYVTPSLGYRAMYKNNDYAAATRSLIALNPDEEEEVVNQNAAYNMEFGFAINYSLNKKWRAKAGMQFNHTNYIVNAGQLFHPSQTTMILTDQNTGLPVVEAHTSYYSNRPTANNETRLTNSTIQFSVPVGIDYALMDNKRFAWRLGLTIQPTYIANGEAYLISSDTKNYVSIPSLMRKWNANASLESFVSYKTNAGFTIDFGPQFRYQMQSTYTKQYGYSEKLYNIGLKIGITRGF